MVASFYHECGPQPVSNNAARWYRPCLGKLFIGQAWNNAFFPYQQGHKIDWLSETVRNWATAAAPPVLTNCTTGSTYLSYFTQATGDDGIFGASIDIWAALRAGAWSSSTTIAALCDGLLFSTTGRLYVGILDANGAITGPIWNSITPIELAPNCSTLPVVSRTVTVYDDGTYAIS